MSDSYQRLLAKEFLRFYWQHFREMFSPAIKSFMYKQPTSNCFVHQVTGKLIFYSCDLKKWNICQLTLRDKNWLIHTFRN